jgi:hypothetical protein
MQPLGGVGVVFVSFSSIITLFLEDFPIQYLSLPIIGKFL